MRRMIRVEFQLPIVLMVFCVAGCDGGGIAPKEFGPNDRIRLYFVRSQEWARIIFADSSRASFVGSGINLDFSFTTRMKGSSEIILNGTVERRQAKLRIRLTFNKDNKTGIARCTLSEPGKKDASMYAEFTLHKSQTVQ